MELGTDGAVGGDDEGLVGGGEEDLQAGGESRNGVYALEGGEDGTYTNRDGEEDVVHARSHLGHAMVLGGRVRGGLALEMSLIVRIVRLGSRCRRGNVVAWYT